VLDEWNVAEHPDELEVHQGPQIVRLTEHAIAFGDVHCDRRHPVEDDVGAVDRDVGVAPQIIDRPERRIESVGRELVSISPIVRRGEDII
jgi:hypothetical protein